MAHLKFDVAKLERLNDPGRFESLPPQKMWDALGRPDARTVVDIGAGTGLFAAAFAALAPLATIYAVDNEPVMVDWMKEHRPEVTAGRLVPVVSAETSLPLADGIADVVIMINVHHELADPDAVYGEAFRVLAPGGRVLVVDWAPHETPKGPPLNVRAEPTELVDFLAGAGFTEARVHEGLLDWHSVVTAVRAE